MRSKKLSHSELIEIRTLEAAKYIVENKVTLREVAKKFGITKSTVQYDMSERLKNIDSNLKDQVDEVLKRHSDTKHIRGGEANRERFTRLSECEMS